MRKRNRKNIRTKQPKKLPPKEGILMCSKTGGFGFVVTDDDSADIYVCEDYFRGAHHNDKVLCRPISGKHRKGPEGIITQIIERNSKPINAVVSEIVCGSVIAYSTDCRFYPEIIIDEEDSLCASVGDRIIAEVTNYADSRYVYAIALKNLGKSGDVRTDIESIIYKHSIKDNFNDETIKACESIKDKISEKDLLSRLDLRKEIIFTIDGDDAKDYDDAVSIKRLPGGGYKLGVHIADVSHYVKHNSAIDKEAFERGTSVYLPDRVIPMLPEKLSNGVCSLLPDCDRLTFSCIMNLDKDGNVIKSEIKKSVIRSRHRMTYTTVQKIIDGDKSAIAKHRDIVSKINIMNELSDILISKRSNRGCVDFELPEAKAIIDEKSIPKAIEVQKRLKSHKIIEEFMLLANETVAKFANSHSLPFVYRTHSEPDYEKLINFNSFLLGFNLSIPENLYKGISASVFKQLIDSVKGSEIEGIVSRNTLRTMMKASYSTANSGHFGLALSDYCHFTSPIRRYPDLTIHRILTSVAEGKDVSRFSGFCEKSASLSTDNEIKAEECERDCMMLMKIIYISNYIGKEFTAQITSLTEYGIYAELDNTIEGMIKLSSIDGDYYCYDSDRNITKGKRKGRVFKLGDKIKIKVASVNKELLQIDFELAD